MFIESFKSYGIKQSFSYSGYPNDNACMEGFYSILRRDEININFDKYENSRVIKDYLNKYFSSIAKQEYTQVMMAYHHQPKNKNGLKTTSQRGGIFYLI